MLLNRKQRRTAASFERRGIQMADRTREQINNEYANTCAQIGERSFQISTMEADIESLKQKIVALGKEIKSLDEKEKQVLANAATAQPIIEVPNASATTTA
jgi:chromosome segregation ATPase